MIVSYTSCGVEREERKEEDDRECGDSYCHFFFLCEGITTIVCFDTFDGIGSRSRQFIIEDVLDLDFYI